LEGAEFGFFGGFFGAVLRDVDVDYAARRDVGWEEDGGELDLEGRGAWVSLLKSRTLVLVLKFTRRLSGVKRTVTPASTLPTVRETSISWGCVVVSRPRIMKLVKGKGGCKSKARDCP
jgi:hypothetical protein